MKKLSWESEFFQMECAEIDNLEMPILQNEFHQYDWIQGKTSIMDKNSIENFEQSDFKFEDLRIELHKKVRCNSKKEYGCVRKAKIEDSVYLKDIAQSTLVNSSRYLSLVGRDKTKAFYEQWVTNAIAGIYDDCCYVIELQNKIVGFITFRKNKQVMSVSLIAVSTTSQSHGLGRTLIDFAEALAVEKECKSLSVVTSGRNIRALQFYISLGFNIEKIESWYYKR